MWLSGHRGTSRFSDASLLSVHPRVCTVQCLQGRHVSCPGHTAEHSQDEWGSDAQGDAEGTCQGKWNAQRCLAPLSWTGLPASGEQGGSGTAKHVLLCLSSPPCLISSQVTIECADEDVIFLLETVILVLKKELNFLPFLHSFVYSAKYCAEKILVSFTTEMAASNVLLYRPSIPQTAGVCPSGSL